MKESTLQRGLEYYMKLPYTVSLRPLTEAEGGGFVATIPQLGDKTFVAVGESREEALGSLDELKRILFEEMLERGVSLPEPITKIATNEHFSGTLLLRVPRELHARISSHAKANSTSINKLATQYLSEGLERQQTLETFQRQVSTILDGIQFLERRIQQWNVEKGNLSSKGNAYIKATTLSDAEGTSDDYAKAA